MKGKNIFIIILNSLNLVLTILFFALILYLNIIPKKYLIIATIVLILFDILSIILTHKKKKILKVIGFIIISLLIIIKLFISYYSYKGNLFFDKTFNTKSESKTSNESSYNIYINGKDFASINDFNMIISIDMKNHKVLLTSIPRDYHINVYGTDIQDNLCFIGMDDINTSIKSLEQFFDIDINYYLKINTHSLVDLVDALDGINYCSDISFTTTHSLVLDTYNDTNNNKLTIKKGCQHLNGIETLTLARERIAFPGSDIQRQKNCQAILLDIFDSLLDTNTIINFDVILDKLSNLYETNIPKDIVQKIIKDNLNGEKWDIEEQSVYGKDEENGLVRMNTVRSWIMIPNMDSVESAKEKIKNITKKD